jgi:predicted aspartyl protease
MKYGFRPLSLVLLFLPHHEIRARQVPAALSTDDATIPFQVRSGFLITVKGRIGPLSSLKFVLDTGTSHTVIDSRIADKLLLPRQKAHVLTFNQNTKLESITLPELQLGPLRAHNLHVMVGDLKQISGLAFGTDAIVGLDVLRTSQILSINYATGLVTFRTSAPVGLAKHSDFNVFTVHLPMQGYPACLILDTGLQGLVLYSDRLREHALHLHLTGEFSETRAGWLIGRTATLPGVRLGPDERPVSVLLVHGAPAALPADIDGYVGTDVLHARWLEFNFASNTLRWQ